MTRPVLMPCECCQSEGRIYRSNGGPDETDCGPCPVCEETGMAIVPSDPVEPDDEYFTQEVA